MPSPRCAYFTDGFLCGALPQHWFWLRSNFQIESSLNRTEGMKLDWHFKRMDDLGTSDLKNLEHDDGL
jgi:hypothetical protein